MKRKKYSINSPLGSVEKTSKPVLFKCAYVCEEREQLLSGCCALQLLIIKSSCGILCQFITFKKSVDL